MRITRRLPILLLLCGCSLLWSMPAPQSAVTPGTNQDFEIPAEATQNFSLKLPPGKISTVTFHQIESSIRVRTSEETSSNADAHFNQGGRLTSIVFHAAGLYAPANGQVLFIVENKSHRPAKFHLNVAATRPAAASDSAIVQAEEDSAHALALAASQTTETVRQSLPVFISAEAAWRALDQPAPLAQLLSVHVHADTFLLNDQADAFKQLPELLHLADRIAAIEPAEAANLHKTAGSVYANQARYDDALKQYGEALQLFEGTSDLSNQVALLESRSKVERIQGDNARALADVDAALPRAQQNHDMRGEEALEVERGAIAYESGQLGPAYEADLRAISLVPAQPQSGGFLEAEAWSDLALVYLDLHDYEQSSNALDRAEAIWKKSPNTDGQLETREDRAKLRLAEGDIAGARTVFQEGAEEAKTRDLARKHVAFLRGVATCDMRAGKFAEAETELKQATQEAEQTQVTDELSVLYATTGDLHAAQDHWEQAAEAWQHADDAAQKRNDDLNRSIALGELARASMHLNKLDEAHARCQQAMTAIESVRRQINDNDLHLSFFSSRHALYDLCVQIDMQRNDPESAFTAAERSRARSLLDQAVSSGIEPNIPKEFLDRMTANQQAVAVTRQALTPTRRAAPPSSPNVDLRPLLEQRTQLREEAQQHGYDLAFAAAAMPFTEREVTEHLDADTALIAFWAGSEKSYVWLVTKAGADVKPLPASATLDTRVRQYLDLLSESIPTSGSGLAAERAAWMTRIQTRAGADGAALRRLLLPFAIPPSVKRLLLVKDGALLALSFATLPASPASTYLTTRYELADEPSATFAFRASTARAASAPAKIVAFIDPSAGQHEAALLPPAKAAASFHTVSYSTSSTGNSPGSNAPSWTSPLPYAREEARVLEETFGPQNATIFTGSAATRAQALSLDWSSYALAHFAAHAVYRKTHPELSGIVLSPTSSAQKPAPQTPVNSVLAADPPTADLLSFSDVLRMKTPPPLVVLSACNSGVGSFVPGEGMLALDTAFLASGSSQVISTLWPVDDQASSIFMREFYRALSSTHSAIQSMQRAQRTMATSKEWSAPYYWGAFTLSGDWRSSNSTITLPAQP